MASEHDKLVNIDSPTADEPGVADGAPPPPPPPGAAPAAGGNGAAAALATEAPSAAAGHPSHASHPSGAGSRSHPSGTAKPPSAKPARERAAGVTPAPSWLGKRVGRFKLLALLGQGAMGRVFRAEDTLLHRHVALKVLPKHVKRGNRTIAVERLIHEARAAAALDHPHAVQVYEVNEANGIHYIAMELIEGGSLYDLVKAGGPMDPRHACQLCAEAAEALAQGHTLGIVHRDVKPGNLMLTRAGRCKVADFGLARVDDPSDLNSVLGESVGTPQFVAPEILRGSPASARSDLYSLGATLWYLVTGQTPYQAKTLEDLVRLHLEAPLPDLKRLRPDLPDGLVKTIYQSMAKNPAERPASAGQFAKILRVHTIPVGANAMPTEADHAVVPPQDLGGSRSRFSGGPGTIGFGGGSMSAGLSSASNPGSSGLSALADLVGPGDHGGGSGSGSRHRVAPNGVITAAPAPQGAPAGGWLGLRNKPSTPVLVGGSAAALVALLLVVFGIWKLTRPADQTARADVNAASMTGNAGATNAKPPVAQPQGQQQQQQPSGAASPAPPVLQMSSANPQPAPPPPPVEKWVDLKRLVDPANNGYKGTWRFSGGDLVSDESGPAICDIPFDVPEEYDFRIEFTANDCVQQLCYKPLPNSAQFPPGVAFNWCMNVGEVMGFEAIDGQHVFDAGAPTARKEKLPAGTRHVSVVEVRNDGIKAVLDGKVVAEWKTDYKDLSRLDDWSSRDPSKLAVGTWNKPTRFHKIELIDRSKKKDATAAAKSPAPASPTAAAAAAGANASAAPKLKTAKAGPDGSIDLMPLIDPNADAARGSWRVENGDLVAANGQTPPPAILEIPVAVPAEYDFYAEFTPDGVAEQLLFKPGPNVAFNWCMGAGPVCGFESVGGKQVFDEGAAATVRQELTPGVRHTSLVKVRHDRAEAYLDGKLLVTWDTSYGDLSRRPDWAGRDPARLGLGIWDKPARFHKVTLTDRTGQGG